MNQIFKWIKICMVALLTSCSGISTEHLIDNYYITKIDYTDMELSLSYRLELHGDDYIGVVAPLVFAIGYNNNYIIVKQRTINENKTDNLVAQSNFTPTINNITNYYIIPIKNKIHVFPDENKIGPLTLNEFLIKKKELKIPYNLMFTKIYKNLE
jgi:hypothetical protein